jgi:hypothetical protein
MSFQVSIREQVKKENQKYSRRGAEFAEKEIKEKTAKTPRTPSY